MNSILLVAGCLFVYMTAWYLAALAKEDNSLADIAWGPGFILVALVATLWRWEATPEGVVALLLVTIWGLRLAYHIGARHRGEDARYQAWRRSWKRVKLRSFLQVFMLQGVLLLAISAPVLYAVLRGRPAFSWWTVAGTVVWLAGFIVESVADRQLAAFKRWPENKGRVMKRGLWRYSRHPNYFGEAVQWWGLYLVALSAPGGWTSIYGPLVITVLLRFVSGVPLLERRYEGHPEYERYKKRTNAFIPWFNS